MRTALALAREIGLNCVGHKVRLTSRAVTSVFDEAFAPLGLKASQMNLIVTIARLGTPSAAYLCAELEMDKSTLSRNLARLRQKGWAIFDSEGGRRGKGVSLTASGERLLVHAYPAWKKAQAAMLRKLGDQGRVALNTVMRKVRLASAAKERDTIKHPPRPNADQNRSHNV
jgi:DNA-binding MarR family transcriptional regulator